MTESLLPWQLRWEDLQACLPDINEPIDATATHDIAGLHHQGRSCVLTVRYHDAYGIVQSRVVFLKITADIGSEAEKYSYLTTIGAPVPQLLNVVSRAGDEILILEFLPRIGTVATESGDLLELIARVNAIPEPPTELFRPNPGDPNHGARVRESLISCALQDADSWSDAYRHASRLANSMPVALNHNELAAQQLGWTDADPPRLVMFDLETMALLPRYTDVASVLAPLSAQTGQSERELFGVYLAAFARHTGQALEPDEAWKSMIIVRIVRTVESLPWLLSMADHPDTESPEDAVARLRRDLAEVHLR